MTHPRFSSISAPESAKDDPGCGKKQRYLSRDDAKKARTHFEKTRGKKLSVYKCRICGYFHLTSWGKQRELGRIIQTGETQTHRCHWPGCKIPVPPSMWGCKRHWFKLPKHLRDAIWACYVPGQEIRKDPTPEYLAVARRVNEWCREYEARRAKEQVE